MVKLRTSRPVNDLMTDLGLSDLREIGRGATSTVFVARQPHLARDVAIKVFAQPLLNQKARRRFERECQSLGTVSAHPNVVTLLSSGFDGSERPFMMMEYCPGGSLYDVINTSGPLAVADVLRLGVKLCSALQLAHDNGLLHRDIKPANVLLTAWKEPALADFGIAGGPGELSVTVGDSLTPLYAAPEVLEAGGGSPASDVWSLASTLYALLLGHAPYAGTNEGLLAILNRIISEPLPPLSRDDVSPVVLKALAKGMEKDPRKRTSSARVLGEALQAAQQEMGLTVTEYLQASTADAAIPHQIDLTSERGPSPAQAAVVIPDQQPEVVEALDSETDASPAEDAELHTRLSKRHVAAPPVGEQPDGLSGGRRKHFYLALSVALVAILGVAILLVTMGASHHKHQRASVAKHVPVIANAPIALRSECLGYMCHFDDLKPVPRGVSYRWQIANHPAFATTPAASYRFADAGNYPVSLSLLSGNHVVGSAHYVVKLSNVPRHVVLSAPVATGTKLDVAVAHTPSGCRAGRALLQRRISAKWHPVYSFYVPASGTRSLRAPGPGLYHVVLLLRPTANGQCATDTSSPVRLRAKHAAAPKVAAVSVSPSSAPAAQSTVPSGSGSGHPREPAPVQTGTPKKPKA